jgi:hypothetical protein
VLSRHRLRDRHDEIGRQPLAGCAHQRGDEAIERAQAPRLQLCRHRLDPDADERRQGAVLQPGGHLLRRRDGMAVLFGVRTVTVAVLEIEPVVLDRLGAELVDDAGANRCREGDGVAVGRVQVERRRKRWRIGRIFLQRRRCQRPELRRGIGPEQMRAAVDRVHRLTSLVNRQ